MDCPSRLPQRICGLDCAATSGDNIPTPTDFLGAQIWYRCGDFIVGDVRPVLLILLSGAGLLLLIACVNVTTLLLARSDKRRREIAVRGAMGASSSRLFHQFAIEGFVLACGGVHLRIGLRQMGHSFADQSCSGREDRKHAVFARSRNRSLDIAFACGISLLAGMAFSVIPIARTSLAEMIEGLKEGARGSAGTTWRRFGSSLVVVEVALAMVLMVSAGLLGKSLYQLLHLDIGFGPDQLAYFQTSWAPGKYGTDHRWVCWNGRWSTVSRHCRASQPLVSQPLPDRFRVGNRLVPYCGPAQPRREQ